MSKRAFSKLDPQSHVGKSTTWLTPLSLINSLGDFDLDPCGYRKGKRVHPTARRIWTLPKDGLKEQWKGRVWLNPPYGRGMEKWIEKLEEHGNGISLIFSRTDTKLFHSIKPDLIFFIEGRIAFLNKHFKTSTNAGTGSILLAYGRRNVRAILSSGIEGRAFTEGSRRETKKS